MCHSPDAWYCDSAPPTPTVVVSTDYFLTPPPSPLATPTADDHAPCPPTPHCVPFCVQEEEPNALDVSPPKTATSFDPSDPHLSHDPEGYASPSPILKMIERAAMDSTGLESRRVNYDLPTMLNPCDIPLDDHESFDYYSSLLPSAGPEHTFSYRFSIGTIQELRHDLRIRWRSVNPEPIPPIIIRLDDLIQPCNLRQRQDARAFVMPAENGIFDTLCQRGVDSNFRPISPSAVVDAHHPRHVVASKFAVNIFLESPRSDESIRYCDYLGAYVLQVEDMLTVDVTEPCHLPYVCFHYYMWDASIVRLADELRRHYIVEPGLDIAQREHTNSHLRGFSCSLGSILNINRYGHVEPNILFASRTSSPIELDYEAFLDFGE